MAPASAVCVELGLPSLERARKLWKSPPKESPPIHGSRGSHGSPYRAFERLYLRPWKSWKSRKLYKTVLKALLQHFLDTKSSISSASTTSMRPWFGGDCLGCSMQTSMTSMTSVVWGRLFETVYGDFRDFHGLAELGRPFLEMRGRNAGHPPCGTER